MSGFGPRTGESVGEDSARLGEREREREVSYFSSEVSDVEACVRVGDREVLRDLGSGQLFS